MVAAQRTSLTVLAMLLAFPQQLRAEPIHLSALLGTWQGVGNISYSTGTIERLHCNSFYSGGDAELRMTIRCMAGKDPIHFRVKIRSTNGRQIEGEWEERTYNLAGPVTGSIGSGALTLNIVGGGISGVLTVVGVGLPEHSVVIKMEGAGVGNTSIRFVRSIKLSS